MNLTSDSFYKTLNIPFIYSHNSIVMLTGLQIKSLSERTKSSWSLKLYPALYLYPQNLEWQHRSSLRQSRDSKNISILLSHYRIQHFIHIKIYLLILYPYMGVPQTVHLY